ncbi:MAG: RNA 2',3'-cyclic phosphodiesterase [Gammaproteobacteria bacterium]
MARLFFALWPDAATRRALAAAAAQVDVRDARRMRVENLHLTVAFLGEVTPLAFEALAALPPAPDVRAFTLDIGLAGWWRGSRVAWLAPLAVPAALGALHDAVNATAQGAGIVPDQRPYRPHVTIARAARRAPRAAAAFEVHWQVTDFALVESIAEAAGPCYRVRRHWPLAAPARD